MGSLGQAKKLRMSFDPASRGHLKVDNLKKAFGVAQGIDNLNEMSDEDEEANEVVSRGRTASQAGNRKSATFSETLAK